MILPQRTITGELRKWRLLRPKGEVPNTVIGYMYNDLNDIWEDGDEAVIRFIYWWEAASYYLIGTKTSCIKLEKDEEKLNGVGSAPEAG